MLTPKQQRFVQEYLVDLNATQAAIRAGYAKRSAAVEGVRLLRNAKVAEAVTAGQQERSERVQVDQDYVVGNAREVVERCMERAPVMVRRNNELVQLVDGNGNNVWQFDARGALGALTLLGKHLGLFTEKVEVNATHTHYVVNTPPKGASREAWQSLYSRN